MKLRLLPLAHDRRPCGLTRRHRTLTNQAEVVTYPFSKALSDEFRTFNLVVRLSLESLDENSLTLPHTKRGFETWDHAEQFMLEAFNEQLNRIVDSSIASILLHVAQRRFSIKMSRWSRNDALRYLEKQFAFLGHALPGWRLVDRVNRDANASKHRVGLHWAVAPDGTPRHVGTVALFPNDIAVRTRATRRWLRALGAATRMD